MAKNTSKVSSYSAKRAGAEAAATTTSPAAATAATTNTATTASAIFTATASATTAAAAATCSASLPKLHHNYSTRIHRLKLSIVKGAEMEKIATD